MTLNQFEEYFKMFFDKLNFYNGNLRRLLPTGVVDHVWSRSKMAIKLRCTALKFICTSVAISLPSDPISLSVANITVNIFTECRWCGWINSTETTCYMTLGIVCRKKRFLIHASPSPSPQLQL